MVNECEDVDIQNTTSSIALYLNHHFVAAISLSSTEIGRIKQVITNELCKIYHGDNIEMYEDRPSIDDSNKD